MSLPSMTVPFFRIVHYGLWFIETQAFAKSDHHYFGQFGQPYFHFGNFRLAMISES